MHARRGDRYEGADALYEAVFGRLVASLYTASGDRATTEDVAQEAFVRLLCGWSTVRDYEDPEGWLRRVAYRLLANRQRDARNRLRVLHGVAGDRSRAGHGATDDAGDAVDLERALAKLTLDQRRAVVLYHLHRLSVAEVADYLQVPEGTVKSRLSRARSVLTPLLEKVHD